MSLRLRHPTNGYVKVLGSPGFLCLLFGPLYFVAHGIWTHAVISAVLAVATMGLSWVIYPLAAGSIVRDYYLSRGWVLEPPPAPAPKTP